MKTTATDFKQNFGRYSKLVRSGEEKEIQITNRGEVIGVYTKPKRSERVPFIGIDTLNVAYTREELHER
jgi:hypothetical protein